MYNYLGRGNEVLTNTEGTILDIDTVELINTKISIMNYNISIRGQVNIWTHQVLALYVTTQQFTSCLM